MFSPKQALSSIQKQHPQPLTLIGKFSGGESGAYHVTDGTHEYGLKIYDYSEAATELPLIQNYLITLKSRGYPAPQILAIAAQEDSTACLQEFIAGDPLEPLDPDYLPQILQLNQHQAEITSTPSDWPKRLLDTLLVGGQGYCIHSSLKDYSTETNQVLSQIQGIAHESTNINCAKRDLVHFDFHGGNIFVKDNQISGVIDWAGACVGDRFFDLSTLVYYYYLDPSLRQPVETEILSHIPKSTLRLYYAHMILRQLDWSIRHHGDKAVAEYLTISQQILVDYP